MDEASVTNAVHQLTTRGEAPSVRKVHALIGGSFRDILKLMKSLPAEETPMVTETAPAPVLPQPVGKLAQARHCLEEVEARFQAAQARAAQLARELQAVQGAPLPDIVTGAQLTDRDAQRHNLQRALAGAQAQMQGLQREVTKARQTLQSLEERVRMLPTLIKNSRFDLSPQGLYGERLRKAQDMARRMETDYDAKTRALGGLEDELRALTGEG